MRPADSVPVTVATALQRDVPVELAAIGTVEPFSTVAIKAQVEGQLAAVHFEEGQTVRQGDLLFSIDPRPFEAALHEAEANLARDRAQSATAEVDATRRAELVKQGFIAVDEFDQAHTRAAALRATVKAEEAAVERARLQLQYCSIRSPIDGRIGQRLADPGNIVKANDTTLAVVNQIRPVYVSFSVPEQQLARLRARAAAGVLPVRAAPEATEAVTGELRFINNAVDPTTGTVLLKGWFANDDERLWPGQFAQVSLELDVLPGAVLVPAEAIQIGQQGRYVFVVTAGDVAEVRPVAVGESVGAEIVVAEGLAAGERVVTDGQLRLGPGAKVEIKTAAGHLADTATAAAGP